MLDKFLEVAYQHEKTASDKRELVDMLAGLPNDELIRVANGESELNKMAFPICNPDGSGGSSWLDQFKGTPLFEQAIDLEQRLLEIDMMENEKRQRDNAIWNERDRLCVQKRMLELQRVEQESGAAPGAGDSPTAAPTSDVKVDTSPGQSPAPPPDAAAAPSTQMKTGSAELAARFEKAAKEMTRKQKVLSVLGGGPPGYFGAKKAVESGKGTALAGTLRGAGGWSVGGLGGSMLGGAAGGLAGEALGETHPGLAAVLAAGLPIAGGIGGALGGYKALTHKYNEEPKVAKVLTEASRDKIKTKNFALSAKQTGTGEPGYPIEDKRHAANALSRVKQFGSPKQRSEVYKDVAKKFPALAARSDVPAVKAKAKHASAEQLFGAAIERLMNKEAIGFLGAAKGLYNVAKGGLASGGVKGALTGAGKYFGAVAKNNPLAAAGLVAAPVAAGTLAANRVMG